MEIEESYKKLEEKYFELRDNIAVCVESDQEISTEQLNQYFAIQDEYLTLEEQKYKQND